MKNSQLLALALVGGLILSACSDDDYKPAPDQAADKTSTPDVAADTTAPDQAPPDQAAADTQAADTQTADLTPDKGSKPDAAAGCGSITDVGCCDGAKVKYCDKGVLKTIDCAKSPKCGWESTFSYYDCGTSGGSDPKGKYPKSCSGKPGDMDPPTDATKDTSVAKDTGGTTPDGGSSTTCGGVTYEGCCAGTTLKYCEKGVLKTLNCSSYPKCGWDSSYKVYDCGTSGGSDPSGKNPKTCTGGVKDSGPVPDASTKDAGPPPDGVKLDGVTATGVVITEMMINSKVAADSKGEWFELYNAGSAAVNLHGWSITDKAGSSQNKHTISASGGKLLIQPGKYLVLGKSTDTKSNGNVPVAYAYGKSTWDLGNSGDEIFLYDAAKKLVDKVEYTKSWTIPNGATLSLKSPSLDNSISKSWCVEKTKWCSTCDMGTPGKKAGCK